MLIEPPTADTRCTIKTLHVLIITAGFSNIEGVLVEKREILCTHVRDEHLYTRKRERERERKQPSPEDVEKQTEEAKSDLFTLSCRYLRHLRILGRHLRQLPLPAGTVDAHKGPPDVAVWDLVVLCHVLATLLHGSA